MMPCYFLVHFLLLVKNEKQIFILEGSTMRCRYINNLFFVFYFFGSIYVRSQCLYVVQRATLTWIIPAVKLYISSFGFDVVVVLLLFTAAVVSCPKMRNRIMTITLFFSIIILNYSIVYYIYILYYVYYILF